MRNNFCFTADKTNEFALKSSSELRTKHVKDGGSPGFTISSDLVDRIGRVYSSRNYGGMTNEGNFFWPSKCNL
jgi:hypothetical protein